MKTKTLTLFFVLVYTLTSAITPNFLDTLKIKNPEGGLWTIEEAMIHYGLPGLSIAVIDNYQIIGTKEWGVKQVGQDSKVDKETVFSTASISKAIAATLIVYLSHEGYFSLDEPINNYLKRWKLSENEFTKSKPVTFRNILSHTSGATQHGFTDFYVGDDIPTIIESLEGKLPRYDAPLTIDFEPGSQQRYSGGAYTLAQVALEDIMGSSLPEMAKKYFFEPLKMNHSTFYQPNEKEFFENAAYAHNNDTAVIGLPICPQLSASGLWSTPTDMSKFIIEIQNALLGKGKVLKKEVAKEMLTVHAAFIGWGDWSLGWERNSGDGNLEWFSHGGANTGIGGYIMGSMENGKGIAMFGNGPNSRRLPVLGGIQRQIVKDLNWKVESKHKKQIVAIEGDLDEFTGRYWTPFGQAMTIVKQNDQLAFKFGPEPTELFHVGDNNFYMDESPFGFTFKKHDDILSIFIIGNGRDEPTYAFPRISKNTISPIEYYENNGYDKSLVYFKELLIKEKTDPEISESSLNRLGYGFINNNEYNKAIEVFKLNVELYPDSYNTYDSLGEAYMINGEKDLAIKNYKKSLELNARNENAKQMIEKMEKE